MGYRWILAAAALCAAGPASAATYVVATNGSDSNDGVSAPFRTLQRAAGALRSGDTILLRSGSYAAGIEIENLSNVTIRGEGSVTLDGRNASTYGALTFYDVTGLTLENFTLTGASLYGVYSERIDRAVVRNCEFANSGKTGFFTAYSDDLLIENVRAHHSGQEHGIYLARSCDRVVVRNCTLFTNGYAGLQINALPGDSLDSPSSSDPTPNASMDCIVENNTMFDNNHNGAGSLSLMGVHRSMVRNNLIHSNRKGGIVLTDNGWGSSYACKNNQIYHNTIVFQSGVGQYGIGLRPGSTGNTIMNNIIVVGAGDCIETDESVQSNYNCFRGSSVANGGSLSSWRSATGNDQNSLEGDPGLTGDYHLSASSPAIDGGVALTGMTVDKGGMLRPQGANPDVGCYEFGGAAGTPPPTNPPPTNPPPTNPPPTNPPPTNPPPSSPGTSEFKAVPADRRVDLSWKASNSSSSVGYYVYRSTSAGTGFRPITSRLRTTAFADRSVSNGTTYYYRLYSVTPTRSMVLVGGVISATPGGSGGTNPPAGGGGNSVVYDDALRSGWQVQLKTAQCNLAATAPVAQGSRSMGITISSAGGAVRLLGSSGVSLSGKQYLKLLVHGGTAGGQRLSVDVLVNGEWMGVLYLPNYGGLPRANAWTEYTIPLSALDIAGGNLTGLIFSSPRQEGTAYLDNVRAE
jgi:parallel beta helix pectate lyase-like protein